MYMSWVWFSVGAENLAKAAIVCNGEVIGDPKPLGCPIYSPQLNRETWINEVLHPNKSAYGSDSAQRHPFMSLGAIWESELYRLAGDHNLQENTFKEIKAAYQYLTQKIRNRDAHTYRRDERRTDFPAVEGVFAPAFNTLVRTMKNNGHFSTNPAY